MRNRLPMFLSSIAVGIVFAGAALILVASEAKAKPAALSTADMKGNPFPSVSELTDLASFKQELSPAEKQTRIAKTRELIDEGRLRNGPDYFLAAKVIALGKTAEDALQAHDLGITALALGETRAAALVASTEDAFLVRIGHPQRFGTHSNLVAGKKTLGKISPSVTDGMRHCLGLPSLIQAQKKLVENRPANGPANRLVLEGSRGQMYPSIQ